MAYLNVLKVKEIEGKTLVAKNVALFNSNLARINSLLLLGEDAVEFIQIIVIPPSLMLSTSNCICFILT